MLAIKFIIRVAISEVPEWVSVEMAKLEFSRREALRVSISFYCYIPQLLNREINATVNNKLTN